MATYLYQGPFLRIAHPVSGKLIALRSEQQYDLPANSLPTLMDPARAIAVGRLSAVEPAIAPAPAAAPSPRPKASAKPAAPAPDPEPKGDK